MNKVFSKGQVLEQGKSVFGKEGEFQLAPSKNGQPSLPNHNLINISFPAETASGQVMAKLAIGNVTRKSGVVFSLTGLKTIQELTIQCPYLGKSLVVKFRLSIIDKQYCRIIKAENTEQGTSNVFSYKAGLIATDDEFKLFSEIIDSIIKNMNE